MLTQTEKLGYLAINEHLTESSSLLSGIARIFCLRVALHFVRVGCKWRCGGSPLCQSSIAVHYYADGQYFFIPPFYAVMLQYYLLAAEVLNMTILTSLLNLSHTHPHTFIVSPLANTPTNTHEYSFPLFTQTYPSHHLSSQ